MDMDSFQDSITKAGVTFPLHHRKFSKAIVSSLMMLADIVVVTAIGITIIFFYIGNSDHHDFPAHFFALTIQVLTLS